MSYLFAAELYMRRLSARSVTDARLLVEKEKVRDAVRIEYLAASRDRKVLDKLKERRADAHRRLELVEETKMLDDISGGTAARSIGRRAAGYRAAGDDEAAKSVEAFESSRPATLR